MGIGTSFGAYFDNDHHFAAAMWDHKYDNNDNNVLDPDILNPEDATNSDKNIVEPVTKTQDFLTEVSEKVPETGKYLGELGADEDISYDSSMPIGRRNGDSIDFSIDPKEAMKKLPPDQEGFTLPGNPILWIRKKRDEALTS